MNFTIIIHHVYVAPSRVNCYIDVDKPLSPENDQLSWCVIFHIVLYVQRLVAMKIEDFIRRMSMKYDWPTRLKSTQFANWTVAIDILAKSSN